MKEKETEKERDFLIQCGQSGVSDFLYNKQSRPSRWMNQDERKVWNEGYNLARRNCQR